jgi:hypothetical protein
MSGDKYSFPNKEAICPICKKNKVFEPHEFAVLEGGIPLTSNSKKRDAYLYISFHSHTKFVRYIPIAIDVNMGSFEMYFCSTKCLRGFFNQLVDKLEINIKKAKKQNYFCA